ncbi:alpha/beta fold hydrolase [Serinibacter salmoneus]|uniref:Pimeloyl-ACP methyl ester carboxylesterase n=1 Tax=Serinibacter salmoneus TaxID=556530 RepID=A0A2A9CYZ3_9MICO|nr:alpha/beta hydrolase [Serinibacter salmoneus]PFG19336.1 pimeloyl-ACP methyl ester carboxylesterase [Serinibacter salmoneus]
MSDHPPLLPIRFPGARIGDLWAVATGEGPPLVLLHGNSEDHHVFDALVPMLASRYTLIGLDSRGHGLSPRGGVDLRIADMADDVAATLQGLGLAGVPVLGFSDGGNIALELALRHPDLVGALVLVGANLFPGGLKPVSKVTTDVAHAVAHTTARVLPGLRTLSQRLGLMVTDPNIDPAALGRIAVPALVVVGERDVIRPEHSRLIADSLARGDLVEIPGVGHMIPREAPGELAALVRGLLG